MVDPKSYLVSSTSPSTVSLEWYLGLPCANGSAELSIAPDKNLRLVPPHERRNLATRGLDLEGFVPLSKEEMMARLD